MISDTVTNVIEIKSEMLGIRLKIITDTDNLFGAWNERVKEKE